jgi:hypothetical protein
MSAMIDRRHHLSEVDGEFADEGEQADREGLLNRRRKSASAQTEVRSRRR